MQGTIAQDLAAKGCYGVNSGILEVAQYWKTLEFHYKHSTKITERPYISKSIML